MACKKSPLEKEKFNLLSKQKTANARWDDLFNRLINGSKIDHSQIAQVMDECNMCDAALLERNLFR